MRKRLRGVVTSDKMNKTRRVEIARLFPHPKYGKIVRGRTICYVHDENNESHVNDVVEIIESRPRSRLKRWDLVRIVKKAEEPGSSATDTETAESGGAAPAAASAE